MKKIFFVSKEVSDFLYSDLPKHELNLVNIGVLAFQRNVDGNSGCIYRVVQDGAISIAPFMHKRIIKTQNVEVLKRLISHRYNSIADLPDDEVRTQVDELSPGCFVLYLSQGEAIVLHKCKGQLSTMIAKENLFSLQMRYLS